MSGTCLPPAPSGPLGPSARSAVWTSACMRSDICSLAHLCMYVWASKHRSDMLHLLMQGPNILMDDTLSSEGVDKSLLNAVKDSIVQVPISQHASPTYVPASVWQTSTASPWLCCWRDPQQYPACWHATAGLPVGGAGGAAVRRAHPQREVQDHGRGHRGRAAGAGRRAAHPHRPPRLLLRVPHGHPAPHGARVLRRDSDASRCAPSPAAVHTGMPCRVIHLTHASSKMFCERTLLSTHMA